MESYALFVTFGIKPEEYLNIPPEEIDRIRLRAFYLACLARYQEENGQKENNQDSGLSMSPEAAQALIEERRGAHEY